jgi:hypothetical protein
MRKLTPALVIAGLTAWLATHCTLDRVDGCEYTLTCPSTSGGNGGHAGDAQAGAQQSSAGENQGGAAGRGDIGSAGAGAGAGGETAGANAGAPACDGNCPAGTPVCDVTTNSCVQCLSNLDCTRGSGGAGGAANGESGGSQSSAGAAGGENQAGNAGSAAAEPFAALVCRISDHTCVQCLGNDDCAAPSVCDTSNDQCVSCLEDSQCLDARRPRCDSTSHSCKPCSDSEQCQHIEGKPVCGSAGACVECTAAGSHACADKNGNPLVCDTLAETCSEQKPHSAGLCHACVADAQCAAGQLCVLDTFDPGNGLQPVGYYCHWRKGASEGGAPAKCTTARPYVSTQSLTSIDGQAAEVCVLRASTCIAKNQFSAKDCVKSGSPDDKLCGFAPPADAACAPFDDSIYRCTMSCISDDDCPGTTCDTGLAVPVCSL